MNTRRVLIRRHPHKKVSQAGLQLEEESRALGLDKIILYHENPQRIPRRRCEMANVAARNLHKT